jgi:hypothetical protein
MAEANSDRALTSRLLLLNAWIERRLRATVRSKTIWTPPTLFLLERCSCAFAGRRPHVRVPVTNDAALLGFDDPDTTLRAVRAAATDALAAGWLEAERQTRAASDATAFRARVYARLPGVRAAAMEAARQTRAFAYVCAWTAASPTSLRRWRTLMLLHGMQRPDAGAEAEAAEAGAGAGAAALAREPASVQDDWAAFRAQRQLGTESGGDLREEASMEYHDWACLRELRP